jgi:hypothetical protein
MVSSRFADKTLEDTDTQKLNRLGCRKSVNAVSVEAHPPGSSMSRDLAPRECGSAVADRPEVRDLTFFAQRVGGVA